MVTFENELHLPSDRKPAETPLRERDRCEETTTSERLREAHKLTDQFSKLDKERALRSTNPEMGDDCSSLYRLFASAPEASVSSNSARDSTPLPGKRAPKRRKAATTHTCDGRTNRQRMCCLRAMMPGDERLLLISGSFPTASGRRSC